jgi:hypothetical protein
MKTRKTKQQMIDETLGLIENLPLTRAMAEETAGGKGKDKVKRKGKSKGGGSEAERSR